jgi:cysteine-rich repeat protein
MSRFPALRYLAFLLGLVWSGQALAQTDVVIPVPYSPKSPTVPHPVHEGAPTTLKAYVRNATCGTYTVCWDTNLNGNFGDDQCRDVGRDGSNTLWDIGRTYRVPMVDNERTINVSVRIRNQCTGALNYGTYRMFVYNWVPSNNPTQWSNEEMEILQVAAVDENMWFLHRTLVDRSNGVNNSMTGRAPFSEATGMWIWLFIINGHLPAFPPNTYNAFGQPLPVVRDAVGNVIPNGWYAANDARWAVSPYAETVTRMINFTMAGSSTMAVPAIDEASTFGFRRNAQNQLVDDTMVRLPNTVNGRGAMATQRGPTVYITGIDLGGMSAALPALAGTSIQVGAQAGQKYEWFLQEMIDYLGLMQGDGGSFYGSWYYSDTPTREDAPNHPDVRRDGPWAVYNDLSTTQWAFVGLAGAEENGHQFGLLVNNRHKYRMAEALAINPGEGGGGVYANNYWRADLKLTGGSILGSRYVGLHNLNINDNTVPYPGYTKYTARALRQTYDNYITFTANWWGQRRVHGTHWLDGLWSHGDYLCGDNDGVYSQPRCGNTYGIYSHQKGYRTGSPTPPTIGGRDWNREFSIYYIRAMNRDMADNDGNSSYGNFGNIVDDYCDTTSVTCHWGSGSMGASMGALVLTPVLFNPKPVAIAKVDQALVNAGCAGGNNGEVVFDHAESFHPNTNATIDTIQWDVDASNGLWWVTNAAPDFQTRRSDAIFQEYFAYQYMRPGTFTATLRLVDSIGVEKTATTRVTVNAVANVPPAAFAGTPYVIEVGNSLTLAGNASDSNAGCGDTITVGWDLNNDGNYNDVANPTAASVVAWGGIIAALPRGVDNIIKFRVTDAAGVQAIAQTTLTIHESQPVARFTAGPNPTTCNVPVRFDATQSSHPNPRRAIVRYEWDVDGRAGYEGFGSFYNYAYPEFGNYAANLRITDDANRTATAQLNINATLGNTPPLARISKAQHIVLSGEDLQLDGSGSTDPNLDCGDSIVSYEWDVNGNGAFNDLGIDVTGATPVLPWELMSQRLLQPANRDTNLPANTISLRVTDEAGNRNTTTSTIVIYDANPIAAFQQTPNPAPINVRTLRVQATLDSRASFSPIPELRIVDRDWDLDDDGSYETANLDLVTWTGTIARLPEVGEPMPEFYARLRVRDNAGRIAISRVRINVSLPPTPPTADADPSDLPETGYNILLGQGVTLNGVASFDPDQQEFGDYVRWYRWDVNYNEATGFVADETREDLNSDAIEARLELDVNRLSALGVNRAGRFPLRLQVTDSTGMSNTDDSVIIVHPSDPIARFTASPTAVECPGRTLLDAQSSYHPHPDIDIAEWRWDLDNDGAFDDATGPVVQVPFDQFGFGAARTLRLQVVDTQGRTAVAQRNVTIELGNLAPQPQAGGFRDANGNVLGPYALARGEILRLSAAGSLDPNESCGDRIVRYQWDLKNDGSYEFDKANTDAFDVPVNQLTALGLQNVGRYDVRLRATDRYGVTSDAVTPLLIVAGPTAVAAAVPNRTTCQAQITLDGSASTTDGPPGQGFELLTYRWDLDNDGAFDDASGARTTQNAFALPDAQGNVTMTPRLQVTDLSGRTSVATTQVVINPQNLPPIANAGGPYNTGPLPGNTYAPIRLDGRASYDPDEPCDALTVYKWDIDGDGRFGTEDAPAEPQGALVENFISPLWQPNTTQTVRLKVCDMRNTCSAVDEADVRIQPAPPPLGQLLAPLVADGACIGPANFDVRIQVRDPNGRPVTATVTIAGRDVAVQNIAVPANGTNINVTIPINPANIPEGQHIVSVRLANNAGGSSTIDSGGRIVFDRTPPVLTVGAQLVNNTCYAPTGVPRPTVDVQDNFDGAPDISQATTSSTCERTLTTRAVDNCGNVAEVVRTYRVSEMVPVTLNAPAEGSLSAPVASVNWAVQGNAACAPNVSATLSRNGGASAAFANNAPVNAPGAYSLNLSVRDCAGQTRPIIRRFDINAAPIAVPIPQGHPATDPARANAYLITQGAALNVDGGDSLSPETRDRIVTYAWDFDGDGTADANGKTAPFNTAVQRTLNGALTVTDTIGATGTTPFRITVADVSPDCKPGGPYIVFSENEFTANASNSRPGSAAEPITGYEWNWGDGTPSSPGVRAPHSYAEPGIYDATLTCRDADSETVVRFRIDSRDVAPIITSFTKPDIIYETLPAEFRVEAIAPLESEPITSYNWDFDSNGVSEYNALQFSTVVHQFREASRPQLTLKVHDEDSASQRKYDLIVLEATYPVLLPWTLTNAQRYLRAAPGQYQPNQLAPLADLETYVNRAVWGDRHDQPGVVFQAVDAIASRLYQAQSRGLNFGDDLWSLARTTYRAISRMETAIRSRPGVDLRDENLVKARVEVLALEVYRQAAWETKVRSRENAFVILDFMTRAMNAYFFLRNFDTPLKTCDAAALGKVNDPALRAGQWQTIKDQLSLDLTGLEQELQAYVDAGMDTNDGAADRIQVQAALQALREAANVSQDPVGKICGSGQTCVSDPGEARYRARLEEYERLLARLNGSMAFTRAWLGKGERARQCRYDLGIWQTVDANANGNFLGAFPGKTTDRYWFDVVGESEQFTMSTSDGNRGCRAPLDTRVFLYKVQGNARSLIGSNDNYNNTLCSSMTREIRTGRYEIVVDRRDPVLGIDNYMISVVHVRADGCGDRRVAGAEECDDGNLLNNDGCSAVCRVENTSVQAGGDFNGSGALAGGFNRYEFTLDRRRIVTASVHDGAGGCPGDMRMVMQQMRAGQLPLTVATDDDSGAGPCPMVSTQLEPGSYEIKIFATDGNFVPDHVLSIAFTGACGDRTVDPGEGCDDGNRGNGDGCSSVCTLEGLCGNENLELGEQCDDGNRGNGDGCDLNCRNEVGAVCGDGRVQPPEGCDDGNRLNGDGCSAVCVREPRCGNRIMDAGETCDDGNLRPGDGCSALCQREQPCGNTKINPGEQCDDGNVVDGDGCSALCRVESVDIVAALETRVGSIQRRGSNWFKFVVDSASTIALQTNTGANLCNVDTTLFLFRQSGNALLQVKRDDDSGPELCAQIVMKLSPATYHIKVESRTGDAIAAYNLVYRLDSEINAGGNFRGALPVNGSDLFVAKLAAPRRARFEAQGLDGVCPGDTQFILSRREADGRRVEVSRNDNGNGLCSLIELDLNVGTYDVLVSARGEIPAYNFNATFGDPSGACGNGSLDVGEICDDGNVVALDGCDSRCRLECGNRIRAGAEQCDDGNVVNGDGCSSQCRSEGVCGNGTLEPGEACDDGNVMNGDGCESNCALRALCGNGGVNAGETCDDANLNSGDGCDVLCTREAFLVWKGEDRLVGAIPAGRSDTYEFKTETNSHVRFATSNGAGGCPGNTRLVLYSVANGVRQELAADDDSGVNGCSILTAQVPVGTYQVDVLAPADAPLMSYTVEYKVWVDATEGGAFPGAFDKAGSDFFTAAIPEAGRIIAETSNGLGGCTTDTLMDLRFNGRVIRQDDNNGPGSCSRIDWPVEAGNYDLIVRGRNNIALKGGYSIRVQFARCGDNIVNPGEQCDDGNRNDNDGCSSACVLENLCGNRVVNPGEQCDDGNRNNGDGCSAQCTTEVLCGNGHLDLNEECDDGNLDAGDGCDAQCRSEAAVCGNGHVEGAEQCDDGNQANNDGCSSACALEGQCGNSRIDALEQCDDGNLVDGDGCSGGCLREYFPIVTGRYLHSSSLGRDRSETFKFKVDHRATLRAETTDGVPGSCVAIDTQILLYSYNVAGQRVLTVTEDDAGVDRCSLLSRALNPGNYDLEVRGKNGGALPAYMLDFRLAVNALSRGAYLGSLPVGGTDLFELTVANPTRYTFTTGDGQGGCPGDTVMTMYRIEANGSLTQVATDDESGSGPCSQIMRFQLERNVKYEIKVEGKAGIAIPSYRLLTDIVQ